MRGTQHLLIGAIVAGFLTAVTLILPWFQVGGSQKSSIDLIGSLGALDVIEGNVKRIVVLAWFAIPVLVGSAMLVAASGRYRAAAFLLTPLGPLLGGIVLLVLVVETGLLAWGAYVTALFAIAATASATMVIVRLAHG